MGPGCNEVQEVRSIAALIKEMRTAVHRCADRRGGAVHRCDDRRGAVYRGADRSIAALIEELRFIAAMIEEARSIARGLYNRLMHHVYDRSIDYYDISAVNACM